MLNLQHQYLLKKLLLNGILLGFYLMMITIQYPNQQVMSDRTWEDVQDLSVSRKIGNTTAKILISPKVLVQATSWHRNAEGKVELITDRPPIYVQQSLTCVAVPKTE